MKRIVIFGGRVGVRVKCLYIFYGYYYGYKQTLMEVLSTELYC